MGDLKKELQFFERTVYKNFVRNIQSALYKEASSLRSDLEHKSPKRTGRYSISWRYNKNPFCIDCIASVSIFNPLSYAIAIEAGIEPSSSHPWAVSVAKNTNKGVVYSKGRIWSKKAVGGTINTVLDKSRELRIVRNVANAAVEVFK